MHIKNDKNMEYIGLKIAISSPYITRHEVEFAGLKYSHQQLSRWTKQGLIRKIKKGLYVFVDTEKELIVQELSSLIIEPSYISLETALSMAGLIPEMVFTTTCVTTKKPISYDTYLGKVDYRHVGQSLFFGYNSIQGPNKPYYLAEPEKALLDYIYLNASIDNRDAVTELRLDPEGFSKLDQVKIDEYLQVFSNIRMTHIIAQMRKIYALK